MFGSSDDGSIHGGGFAFSQLITLPKKKNIIQSERLLSFKHKLSCHNDKTIELIFDMAKLNGDNQKPFNCFKNGFRLRSRLVYGTAMKFISDINFFIFSIECLNDFTVNRVGKLDEVNVAANANSTLHSFVIVGESFAAPY